MHNMQNMTVFTICKKYVKKYVDKYAEYAAYVIDSICRICQKNM